jgi:hypothetical protein
MTGEGERKGKERLWKSIFEARVYALEGFAGQTRKPLNRPLLPLSEHQKFFFSFFSKCLENFENFEND